MTTLLCSYSSHSILLSHHYLLSLFWITLKTINFHKFIYAIEFCYQFKEEVASLERLQTEQALSVEELARFKNHANDLGPLMAHLQQQGKNLDAEVINITK